MIKKPTQKEKIEMYERLLHDIHTFGHIACNPEAVKDLIGNISNWSYAHRGGELTSSERQQRINAAFQNLRRLKDTRP